MDAVIHSYGTLDILTQREISELSGPDEGPLKKFFHRCALAVLNTGEETDSSLEVMEHYREFEIRVIQETRGIKLELKMLPNQPLSTASGCPASVTTSFPCSGTSFTL